MAILIKERRLVTDSWKLPKLGPDGALPELPSRGDLIVPLALWQARRGELRAYAVSIAGWLDSHEDPAAIATDLDRFKVIAVNFPKFGDGRGYSIARLLRERYGYKGELRAIGDVLRDHLFFMAQCGFDAFALREDQDPQEALSAFEDFTDGYQASFARPAPLFRRRLSAS